MRRWSASAATATSRRACWRGSIARRRSMRSGKARGNVMCLDVLRALAREGEAARAVLARSGARRRPICRARARPLASLSDADRGGRRGKARAAVERLALLAAAAALRHGGAPEVAELFARTRLEARHARCWERAIWVRTTLAGWSSVPCHPRDAAVFFRFFGLREPMRRKSVGLASPRSTRMRRPKWRIF